VQVHGVVHGVKELIEGFDARSIAGAGNAEVALDVYIMLVENLRP